MESLKEIYEKIVQSKQTLESSRESLDSLEVFSPEEDYGYLRMSDDLEMVVGDLLVIQRRLEVILGASEDSTGQDVDSFREKYDW